MEEASQIMLNVGYGMGKGNDSFATGAETARQAVADIKEHPLSAVFVFASVRYELEEVLRGIRSVVGEAPVLGTTTAGEICNNPQQGSVVVVVLASPYLSVRVGVGEGVSRDWQQAVIQTVSAPEIKPFFSTDDKNIWPQLSRQGKGVFALMFSPGNTRHTDSRSHEILGELKHLSGGLLPIFGGSSADDWRMECNQILLGARAYSDSVLVAVFETHLRFGIGLTHGFRPTDRRATVTSARGHEVLELNGRPAAEVYAQLLGTSRDALEGKHLTLSTGQPAGSPDPYGQYSINVASYFTPQGAVRFSQPVPEGGVLTIMEADQDNMIAAGQEAIRKALLRGAITDPAVAFVFSCALRSRILGERTGEEISGMKEMLGGVPVVGFYSFGEQGLADDGVNRHNNEVITVLVLGQKLTPAAKAAFENERLVKELEQRMGELKRVEEKLRKSKERFQQVAENAQEWIWEVDAHGLYTYASSVVEKILGYKPEELVGKKHFYDLFHPEDREDLKKAAFEVFGQKRSFREFINRNVHKNNETVWFSTSGVPILDEDGNLLGYRGADTDVTEHRRTIEALRESERRYRSILESIEDGYFEVDLAGNLTFFNDSLCRIVGYPRDELMGMNNRGYATPDTAKKMYKTFNNIYQTGRVNPFFS